MKYGKFISLAALGLLAALPLTAVSREALNAQDSLVCASIHVVACDDENNCLQGPPNTFEVPYFMFIDFDQKRIRGADDEGVYVVSPIKASEVTDASFVLLGFENDRGWTLAINRSDGKLVLSSTGPDVHFSISGNCTET
jgi:hypothetical protein